MVFRSVEFRFCVGEKVSYFYNSVKSVVLFDGN